eukprot:CAMPEP_0118649126 /NCGR_PEP_ID=MMETSP0785-20121206/9536_1 /TAXON_ID=91992 /ORGANISM="Bolidomonas pacifica, Strain CCMP 1866" /LENGTH=857 /DNA_ID=CAMNT_0006541391 /DNA_START=643 /DNA_END=3214 /DNA_ORIENTATION=-
MTALDLGWSQAPQQELTKVATIMMRRRTPVAMAAARLKLPSSSQAQDFLSPILQPCFMTTVERAPQQDHTFPLNPKPPNTSLPATSFKSKILKMLDVNQVLIISGSTGCGKSTQVPQFLLSHNPSANIFVTQPRRVAAISLAARVSDELSSPMPGKPNSTVGFNVRLNRRTSPSTQITYMTIGVLLRMLVASDPATSLSHITHIVIDEVHEREVNSDITLALLKKVLLTNRTIRIVIMSATLQSDLFTTYFSSPDYSTASLEIPGRTFPVAIHWLPEIQTLLKMQKSTFVSPNPLSNPSSSVLSPNALHKIDNDMISSLVSHLCSKADGAILIFMPGKVEITSLISTLSNSRNIPKSAIILPLHSTLPQNQQGRVFVVPKEGVVKVIVSTNVAETSLTIPDVKYVIDTGIVKESRFKLSSRMQELTTVWASQASQSQRSGRAGRTSPGECYRLYPESVQELIPKSTVPEIFRTPLEDLILQILLLEENISSSPTEIIPWFESLIEPPPRSTIVHAAGYLMEIGALTNVSRGTFRLSSLGYHLSHLPMDCQVGKILLTGCLLGCLDVSLTAAAILSSSKSMFTGFVRGERNWKKAQELYEGLADAGYGGKDSSSFHCKSDIAAQIAIFNSYKAQTFLSYRDRTRWCGDHALNHVAFTEIEGLRGQFKDIMTDANFSPSSHNENNENAIFLQCVLASGLYPNIAVLERPKQTKKFGGGKLITRTKEKATPQPGSFQKQRVYEASHIGKDAYVVFHSKRRSVTQNGEGTTYLENISFVSRFALLLFAGSPSDTKVDGNTLVLNNFVKFKIGTGGEKTAILCNELRSLCDEILLERLMAGDGKISSCSKFERLIRTIRGLL